MAQFLFGDVIYIGLFATSLERVIHEWGCQVPGKWEDIEVDGKDIYPTVWNPFCLEMLPMTLKTNSFYPTITPPLNSLLGCAPLTLGKGLVIQCGVTLNDIALIFQIDEPIFEVSTGRYLIIRATDHRACKIFSLKECSIHSQVLTNSILLSNIQTLCLDDIRCWRHCRLYIHHGSRINRTFSTLHE